MAEPVTLRRTLGIEWKVKNLFSVNRLATQYFSFGGSTFKCILRKHGSDYIAMDMSRNNTSRTHLGDIRVEVFIEDIHKMPQFSMERSISHNSSYTPWWQYISDLREKEGIITTDGVATFVCVLIGEATSDGKMERMVSTPTAENVEPMVCFESLSRDFHHLLDDSLLSDVTLKCGDHTIPAHRNVLSARSEVFLSMFRSDMAESRTGIIEISDMEPSTLDRLVQYIYSGRLSELTSDSARELYSAADKYVIDSLKKLCGNFMTKNLTQENACNFLVLADVHDDENLKDRVLSFIMDTDFLLDEENWFDFHERYPKLAAEVIHHAIKAKCFQKK